MSRIQSKNHRIGNHEINKASFSCHDDKIYILGNKIDVLDLGV